MDKKLLLCCLSIALLLPQISIASKGLSQPILRAIETDIKNRKSMQFDSLLKDWEQRYGSEAVPPLFKIARDKKQNDANRYVALMGAARLRGSPSAPLFVGFLKDSSWMMRSGALRVLSAIGTDENARAVLPLLKDPALVVRLEAVEATRKLKPEGSAQALVAATQDPANYHGGRATWVPQKALSALAEMQAKEVAPSLKPLLEKQKDPDLVRRTVLTLEKLTGKVLGKGKPLPARVKLWKAELSKKKTA